jgi:hypothetical protein
MYVFHAATRGAPSGTPPTAATLPPSSRAMKYAPPESAGIAFSNSHPKSAP